VGQAAEQSKGYKSIAKLPPEEAAVVEQSKPKRLPPFVLSFPHEASPVLHKDWTLVDGAAWDPDKFVLELRLRGERNKLIHEYLEGGFPVWYPSSGNSMWPLVQSPHINTKYMYCVWYCPLVRLILGACHSFRDPGIQLAGL
ncbi:unnamed protein product, partial [Prorocentrum cordatum]